MGKLEVKSQIEEVGTALQKSDWRSEGPKPSSSEGTEEQGGIYQQNRGEL